MDRDINLQIEVYNKNVKTFDYWSLTDDRVATHSGSLVYSG